MANEFVSDQEVRWCPGCGDYAVLASMQRLLPKLGIAKENLVFISGIGCSSRFPYYLDTYGFHTIHGRAPTIATGVKLARPELSVWIVTGDGDGLSIGASHLLHLIRRNVDVNILLFNNQIYGLTKGQYSPTSNKGKVTKTSPLGSQEEPINPSEFALNAGCSFVARAIDTDSKHLQNIMEQAVQHKGTSFIEILQNCNVYNDGVFEPFTNKKVRSERCVYLEDGQPIVFGAEVDKGIAVDCHGASAPRNDDVDSPVIPADSPVIPAQAGIHLKTTTAENASVHNISIQDPTAPMLAKMFYPEMPVALGIFRKTTKPVLNIESNSSKAFSKYLEQGHTWEI